MTADNEALSLPGFCSLLRGKGRRPAHVPPLHLGMFPALGRAGADQVALYAEAAR